MSKRILFLTPQLPYPLHQGTALRNFGLIDGLARRGHAITLLSFAEPGQPPYSQTPLAELCEQVVTVPVPTRTRLTRLTDLIVGRADMARRLWSPPFLDALSGLLAQHTFDVIHFEGIEMAAYLPHVWPTILERTPDTMLIYDAHNCEYALQRRIARQDFRTPSRLPQALYSFVQAGRLERLESVTTLTVDAVLACSLADAQKLAELRQETPIKVVPNAVDVAAYAPSGEVAEVPHPSLIFTGKMDFRPNVDAVLWFAREILPLIREAIPNAHLTVVGQKPHPRLDALRAQPGVTLTGSVPHIQPYIRAADVYVVPLRMGSGTRLKLLEAMALERPIVSTRLGAEGFDLVDGEHLILADQPDAFARAVVDLLRDDSRRASLGAAAARLVRERYDWSAVIPRVEDVYAQAGDRKG